MDLNGKTAIITGASRGIGLATALRLGRAGANIVIAARHSAALANAAETLRGSGITCEAVTADVGQPAACEHLVVQAVEAFGGVDVVVNNAGYAPVAAVSEMSDADYDQTIAANVNATFYMTRAAWAPLTQRGGGVIVNISSRASLDPFPGFAVYGACKAWVNVFTKSTAQQGKDVGIRVFGVAPGATETQMLRGALPDIPADQTLDPDDIAAMIEAVCGEPFRYSVGQTIFVDK